MFFNKKSEKKSKKCAECRSKISEEFSFCPYCGASMLDIEEEMKEFGMLGRNDGVNNPFLKEQIANKPLGITDKMINSIFNNLLRTLDQQMSNNLGIQNGINIKIGIPKKKQNSKISVQNNISAEQMEKMNKLPRIPAKTHVRRLSDKIVYELNAPGIQSIKDVFVSKLESGYEVKAIGEKKVYVNSLPVNLPLKGFIIEDNKLFVEFMTE